MMHEGLSGEMMAALHRFKKMHVGGSLSSELSKGEFFMLAMIYKGTKENPDRAGAYVSEIAERLRMSPSAVSRMLRGLSERGLVDRKVDEKDRRNTSVFLTAKGDELRTKIAMEMDEITQHVIENMGEADTRKLIELTNKMADLLEAEINMYREKKKKENRE